MFIKSNETRKVQNKNWSYGGIDILNAIEGKTNRGSDKQFYSKHLSPIKKLHFLKVKFPKNRFYISLHIQSKNFDLSAIQLNCIDKDYQKFFTDAERSNHLRMAGKRW